MDFFGMGMGEILLIIIIALIIWGPGKIPEMARQMGKLMRTLRQTSSELTNQIKNEFEAEEKTLKSTPETAAQKPPEPAPLVPKTGDAKGTGQGNDETLTTK